MAYKRRMSYKQKRALEKIQENKAKILEVCHGVPDTSGIYFFTREEDGIKFAYVGQAKHLLTRLAQHLQGFQWIDNSIEKRGLWSEDNPFGWKISFLEYPEQLLDEQEQRYIREYSISGHQLYNATSGGQGKGKKDIADMPTKGYREGLHNGYKKAQKEIAHLFKLHLVCGTKKVPPTKPQEKAMQKFEDFIDVEEEKGGKGD